MIKEPLYWAIIAPRYSLSGFHIMKVTSEKYHQVYGSTKENGPTHCRKEDVSAKFKTEGEAQAKIDAVIAIRVKYKPLHDANSKEGSKLYADERAEVKNLIGAELI